jgi:hypothetical protein
LAGMFIFNYEHLDEERIKILEKMTALGCSPDLLKDENDIALQVSLRNLAAKAQTLKGEKGFRDSGLQWLISKGIKPMSQIAILRNAEELKFNWDKVDERTGIKPTHPSSTGPLSTMFLDFDVVDLPEKKKEDGHEHELELTEFHSVTICTRCQMYTTRGYVRTLFPHFHSLA